MTTLTTPHDLLAAVPFLVGYQPENSLVLIGLKDDLVGMAMRVDFPTDFDSEQIDNLVAHLERDQSESALLVAYLPDQILDCESLLEAIKDALSIRNINLREAIVVKAGRWRSSICADSECCPIEGNPLPVLSDSRIAAEQVALGNPLPFQDLNELVESISHISADPDLLEVINSVPTIDYDDDPKLLHREGAEAVMDLVNEFETGGISKNQELIALVLVRLHDLQVRDFALGSICSENIDLYWNLWRWLLRIAPSGYIAPVATLFAATSYEKGEGALAQRALDRAQSDDDKYPLAKLLRQVFNAGWPPETFATMRADLHPKICDALFSE